MLGSVLAKSTNITYSRAWALYKEYHVQMSQKSNTPIFPVTTNQLAMFISYLDLKLYSPATIATYIAAISYLHKAKNIRDPASHYIINKLITSIQKIKSNLTLGYPLLQQH